MADMFLSLSTLSRFVFTFHEQHNRKANLFSALSIIRKCIFPFHSQHHHGWHAFDYQEVRISISWAAPSRLTRSRFFQPSASTYFHFITNTITTDMFATFDSQAVRSSFQTLSQLTFSLHSWHSGSAYFISWQAPSQLTCSGHFWLSVGACVHFMRCTITPNMFRPLLPVTLSRCVCLFHERHNHG